MNYLKLGFYAGLAISGIAVHIKHRAAVAELKEFHEIRD